MIRPIRDEEAGALLALRRRALDDAPLAFASSPEDDVIGNVEAVLKQLRTPDAILLGAFAPDLAGMVGVYRDRHRKAAHKAHIWGMFVRPEHRGRGLATALLDAALTHARSIDGVTWVHLCVSESARSARRLYERAGFEIWGTEPCALIHRGAREAEHHMALPLESTSA